MGETPAVTAEQRAELHRLLSGGRMASYDDAVAVARATHYDALDVYVFNMALAAALLGPLHMLEVITRNAMHEALISYTGRRDWWLDPRITLDTWHQSKIAEAGRNVASARAAGGPAIGPDDVVAAVDFGFWASLLGSKYEKSLWQPALKSAFPQSRRPRQQLRVGLDSLRRLRNRVSHHEPVHARNSASDFEEIIRYIGFVSRPVATWVRDRSRVPAVLAARPGTAAPVRRF